MMCSICHKPYAPRVNTVMPSATMTMCIPMGDLCYGLNVTFTTFTANTTAPVPLQPLNFRMPPLSISGQFDGLREYLSSQIRYNETEPAPPEEEKPLEWSEVERQLDAFMATLNWREG